MKIHLSQIPESRLRAMRSGKRVSLLTNNPAVQPGDLLKLVDVREDLSGDMSPALHTDASLRFMPAIIWVEVVTRIDDDPLLAAGCSLIEVMRFSQRGQRALAWAFPHTTVHAPHFDLGFRSGLHEALKRLGVQEMPERGLSVSEEDADVVPADRVGDAIEILESLNKD